MLHVYNHSNSLGNVWNIIIIFTRFQGKEWTFNLKINVCIENSFARVLNVNWNLFHLVWTNAIILTNLKFGEHKELFKTVEWNVIIGVKLMGTVNAALCAANEWDCDLCSVIKYHSNNDTFLQGRTRNMNLIVRKKLAIMLYVRANFTPP